MSDHNEIVEIVKELRENASNSRDLYIADVIENLQGQLSVCMEGIKVRFLKNNDGMIEVQFENRWIPVTELPPEGETYGDTTFSVEVLGTEGFTYRKAYYNFRYKVWIDGNEEKEWPSITHWMPLPEPPKEETK